MSPVHYLRKAGEFSTHLAIASFGIGTFLLLFYIIFPRLEALLFVGLAYVAIAFFLNAIVFFHLLYYFITQRNYREYFAVKMLILLANIPISALYVYIIFNFSSTSNF